MHKCRRERSAAYREERNENVSKEVEGRYWTPEKPDLKERANGGERNLS